MKHRIRVVLDALEQFTERIIKKLTLDIVANLVAAPGEGGTPVDTGWARANWVPQIGSPRVSPVGSRSSVSTGAQQAGVATVAASYRLSGGKVFISNNVPYITDLNEGTSQQAPAGFIQAAIVKALTVDLPRGFRV